MINNLSYFTESATDKLDTLMRKNWQKMNEVTDRITEKYFG